MKDYDYCWDKTLSRTKGVKVARFTPIDVGTSGDPFQGFSTNAAAAPAATDVDGDGPRGVVKLAVAPQTLKITKEVSLAT